MELQSIKKKRGRKPKNHCNELEEIKEQVVEKKKRGRKKKYEIENFEKILNRNEVNNFDHNVAYSDDEEKEQIHDKFIKKISFGNLNITVSKKIEQPDNNYRQEILQQNQEILQEISQEKSQENKINTVTTSINENEWESDEEKEIPIENILNSNQENFEKYYTGVKKYLPGNFSDIMDKNNNESIKKIRVVTTIKNITNFEESWPEQTDIFCWWCCHSFDCIPCTLPIKYDPHRKRFKFAGIFCSWNCTKAYNFDKCDYLVSQRSSLITLLVQQISGLCSAINIKPAPPRQALKIFGGYLSIDEFRTNNKIIDKYHLKLLNYNYVYPEITEVTNVKFKSQPKSLRLSRT